MDDIYATPKADLSSDAKDPQYSGFWIRLLASLNAWEILVKAMVYTRYGSLEVLQH